MDDRPDDVLEAIAESALLNGLLDEADEIQARKLAADPEWNTPKSLHAKDLVEAFAVGVIRADCWHRGYKLPPDFEGVVNWIAFNVQHEFADEVVQLSLLDVERLFWEWANQHPAFLKWNETDKLVGVVHRNAPLPEARDFIDLHALIRNCTIHLRTEIRERERFECEFEKEHAGEAD